ncbi:MAG: hypothetical protein J6V26_03545 [Alistipes sp.]|nr:hypothetical protein [Alistipes sp.]
MKIFKILSLAAVLLLSVACDDKPGGDNSNIGSFEAIENEWKLVSVDGVAADFTVYIKFESGIFAMYQQVYSWNYVFYDGEYSVDGGVLSGTYFDGGAWKTAYTGGVSTDGKSLTLKSQEAAPVTYVYEACTIPENVMEEATATRSIEVVPFL